MDEYLAELHRSAAVLLSRTIALVSAADLERPTPCAGWDVSALLAHQSGQERGFLMAAVGGGAPLTAWRPLEVAPDRLIAAIHTTDRALRSPTVVARLWVPEISRSRLPWETAVTAHVLDLVVHGWDLAVALGSVLAVPDPLVALVLEVASAIPDDESRGTMFAPALPAAEGDDFSRALRLLGRDPAWVPQPAAR
ncbi:TIGR03086 family metal-binding protein [Kribbella sp. NPDC026611]|uniref:TIGR03086 family metal-binding protein n=1 Tax=Kribbella sp. NPDC026611 TaxID=3154911 RepID=UPI0033E5962A